MTAKAAAAAFAVIVVAVAGRRCFSKDPERALAPPASGFTTSESPAGSGMVLLLATIPDADAEETAGMVLLLPSPPPRHGWDSSKPGDGTRGGPTSPRSEEIGEGLRNCSAPDAAPGMPFWVEPGSPGS